MQPTFVQGLKGKSWHNVVLAFTGVANCFISVTLGWFVCLARIEEWLRVLIYKFLYSFTEKLGRDVNWPGLSIKI